MRRKYRKIVDIEKMPDYKFIIGFKGVKSVTQKRIYQTYYPSVNGVYPTCKLHGVISCIEKRQDGEIWRCRELNCDEGCFCPI